MNTLPHRVTRLMLLALALGLSVGAHAKTVCDLPKAQVMSDVKTRLLDRYQNNPDLQRNQYQAAERDFDALCSSISVLTPQGQAALLDLTRRYYPSVSLIKSFYEASLNPQNKLN